MRSLDQQRSAFSPRAFNACDDGRSQPLRLRDYVRDRLLRTKGKAVEFEAILQPMLAPNDLADEARTNPMVKTQAPR